MGAQTVSRRSAILGMAATASVTPAAASAGANWIYVEVRKFPASCAGPAECYQGSKVMLRNLMSLSRNEINTYVQLTNSLSTHRGIEELAAATGNIGDPAALHDLPKSEKLAPLFEHPGVFFDTEKLDGNELTADWSSRVLASLKGVGLNFLTEEEMQATPGRPTLSVSYKARTESAGCIIPFSVAMSIKEEIVMVRDPNLKMASSAWSGSSKENLANTNYTPRSALEEVLKKFVKDYRAANPT